jgi:ABC-type Na+ efflux pump permease subunit
MSEQMGREEYEDDKKEYYKRYRRNSFIVGILLGLTLLLAILNIVGTVVAADRSQDKDFEIRLGNYIACLVNGNALREDVRDEFVDLKEEAIIDPYNAVAATIPEGSSARLVLEKTTQRLDRRIKTIDQRIPDVECLKAHPPLEGQEYITP